MVQETIIEQVSIHISVCICTYQRPNLLADLLGALEHQETAGLFRFSIVVVDNDHNRSAEPVLLLLSTSLSRYKIYLWQEIWRFRMQKEI
jgi:hypothetical protein